MQTATLKTIELNKTTRQIHVVIDAKDSMYVEEPKTYGFPAFMNSAPLVEGLNYVLEFGHHAVNAMKDNKEFMKLAEENRVLQQNIKNSNLATRVHQLLSSLEYDNLTDYQAKCVLLVEKELK